MRTPELPLNVTAFEPAGTVCSGYRPAATWMVSPAAATA